MVHRRQVEGETLVFGVHGALWGNAMTWWDHDSGSIWSQPLGEAIVGPRTGQTVELFPSVFTTWGAWREAHPDTVALRAPGGASGFRLEEFLLVIDLAGETVAYRATDVQEVGVINDVVGGAPLALIADPTDKQRWAVFSRQLDDRVIELIQDGETIRDVETGTSWDPVRGIALEGELAGEVMATLPGFTSFPGDFDTFWPEGDVRSP